MFLKKYLHRQENRKKKLEESSIFAPQWMMNACPDDLSSIYTAAAKYMTTAKPYLDPDLKMEYFARLIHTNRMYLSRAINTCSGMNFNRFVNGYRVKYAVDMMEKDRRLKIEEVSRLCGFNSQPSFNYAFKSYMGMTPSEYARRVNRRNPYPQALSNSGEEVR